jgi:signal transduction histidine kinase/DNA-binding response OmpR family regulator/CHASE3 domain sensor protein
MQTQSTFKRNLLVGFGLSLLLLIISSVASYTSIQKLVDSSFWVDHTNKVIVELENILGNLKDAETGQRGYLLTSDVQYLEPYNGANQNALNSLDKIKLLTADNPAQQKSSEDLRKLVAQRMAILQEAIDVLKEKKIIDINILAQGKTYMDSARDIISQMEDRERALLAVRTANQQRFSLYTPILIVVAALFAILITIFFYLRVNNDFKQRIQLQKNLQLKDDDITRRINIIQNVAEKISAGSYDIRVADEGQDGLGGLAYSLNKMASSLERSFLLLSGNEWLQSGIAKLNELLIVEKDLITLTKDAIAFVAEYINAAIGAVYINENNNYLKLYSGFAFVEEEEKKHIKIGDGIAGQSALTRKEMIVKDIPANSIYINYAAGKIKPAEIIAIPVFDGYVLKGVIELGTLASFSNNDLDFLRAAAHNIGLSISTTQNRKRLQELLEETQSQSEELQAQHGELEGLNTELEMQTQKLQASEEELRVQQEELLQANGELEERTRLIEEKNQLITQRNIEIQAKAEELEISTRYKSEFLANMSHELRTPLNSILLLSRLLSENNEANLSNDQVEYAKVIQSSGKGLLSLIDEILDLSKIESGKMDLEYNDVSLKEFLNEIEKLFKPVADEKSIEFKINIAPDLPAKIETDKLRLGQVIRNLLSNALKFTSHGYVHLNITKAADKEGFIAFTVKDTGIGIAANKQALIFEAFQQEDGSTRRKYGGTGLGLSISRQLAKLLNGDIMLYSEQGNGSEFTLVIPAAKILVPASQKALPEYIAPIVAEVKENPFITTLVPENIPDDRNNISQEDKSILIIEDDTNFARSLMEFAHNNNYKALVAVRGDEGIDLAIKYKPVGILLDIQLPVKSGWEVMDELKKTPATRHIPVHIMSSFEVRKESLIKGAVDFINKPVAFDQLQDVFKKIEYVLSHNSKKVLIVEENTKHAKALAYFLESYNVNVEVKENIESGIHALQVKEVDCVILDMGIPAKGSYETLDQVKKIPGLENLPIIIFTGKSLSQAEEMRIKQYADSIVVKTAHSYQRILDEVSLFLHLVEENLKTNATLPAQYKRLGVLNEVLKNKTVLVVDDDVRNIFSLTKALEKYRMNVITAIDGKEAMDKLKENARVDIVLMDMMMPEMDGYETTKRIKKDPALKNIPIIAVTAKAMTGDREKCLNAGASDYITKPVDIDQLMSLLRVWLYERSL